MGKGMMFLSLTVQSHISILADYPVRKLMLYKANT